MYPIERCFRVWHHPTVPPSHDDRIRELCAKAVATTDPTEVEVVLAELRKALHAHIEEFRGNTAKEIPLLFHPQNEAAD